MHHQETLQKQGLKSKYRRKLADALKKARNYHGIQREAEEIMSTLIDLENWLKDTFGIEGEIRIPRELEREIAESLKEK